MDYATGSPVEDAIAAVPCAPTEQREIAASLAPKQDKDRVSILVALAAIYLIWGSTYLAVRIGLAGFPPFFLAGIRFTVSGALLYAVLRGRGAPNPKLAQWGGAAIVGALLLGIGNGGVVVSEQWVGSGLAALGVATVPLWAALFGGFWGLWPSRSEWLGLAVGFGGLILLNLDGGLRASPIGAIALIIAGVSWAFGSVWSRRLTMPHGMMASAAEMLCGGAALLLAAGASGEHFSHRPSPDAIFALVYLIFGAIVGFSAYVYLLQRVRPALATSYAYVNPVIAVALGAAVARERITASGLVALVLILAGVAIVALVRQPST